MAWARLKSMHYHVSSSLVLYMAIATFEVKILSFTQSALNRFFRLNPMLQIFREDEEIRWWGGDRMARIKLHQTGVKIRFVYTKPEANSDLALLP